jgi:DNA invertase Pin-like site-specific DNA recombinase
MRIGLYCRVSTKDQSCDLQLRDLRAYCAARGFTIVREFIDAGQSGAKDSRPELNQLMADARKRKFDSVMVWRFDRFARSTRHLLMALDEFRSLGIQFISYQENIDTSTPLGQAVFVIVSAVSQMERDLIRSRVTAGVQNARANGKQLGRPRRVVDGEQILRMKTAGASLRQIAATTGLGYGTIRSRIQQMSGNPLSPTPVAAPQSKAVRV